MNKIAELLKAHEGKRFEGSTSPFHRWLNPVLARIDAGDVLLHYPLRDEMFNPMNTLHGGVTAGIVDDAVGVALFSLGKKNFHSTIQNNIDYLAPVLRQEFIQVRAVIIKNGKSMVHGRCEIFDMEGKKLLATGTSNLLDVGISIEK
jgi:uncharacterized protein (TIGR00369 family)